MDAILQQAPVQRTNPLAGYLPVQIAMLKRLGAATVDLFVQYEPNAEPLLYHRAGCPLDPSLITKLFEAGINQIYVRYDDFQFFGANLLETIDRQAESEQIPAAERYAALQLAMAVEIEHVARLMDCSPFVQTAEKVGRELTSLLVSNNVLPRDLFRLARHDFNTFTHVTNVASYGVILAQHLKFCKESDFEDIAKAAILHDIGKRFISAGILSKPGRLDPEERAIIETHPQRGYEELLSNGELSHDQLMIVYQHHEKYDGTGYPVGLEADEIHPWARMMAVVDVFDAMTGTRPYRRAATAQEAVDYINKSAGTHFDPEMVQCWNSIMRKN